MAETVSKKIYNKYLSPSLIERAIKSLESLDIYSDWMIFKSPGADTLVISLSRDGKPITVSLSESQDMEFEVKGEKEEVKQFIGEMTAEVASIAAAELCMCLTKIDREELKSIFRDNLLSVIRDSIDFFDE